MTSMASVNLEEKKLKLLKQQLFGKEHPAYSVPSNLKSIKNLNAARQETHSAAVAVDSISMKRDLMKIVIFSSIALAIQLSLFFASKQGLLKLF